MEGRFGAAFDVRPPELVGCGGNRVYKGFRGSGDQAGSYEVGTFVL